MKNGSLPVRLGILTDIQYANKDPIYIEHLKRERVFTSVLSKTSHAVSHLNSTPLSHVIHLGDIVDGNCTASETLSDLHVVLSHLAPLSHPILHVLGNHCLAIPRHQLLPLLNLSSSGSYYVKDLSPRWRLISLDTVEISISRENQSPEFSLAREYILKHSGEINAQEWNGGLSAKQLQWLVEVLQETKRRGMWAIVVGHIPLAPEAALEKATMWGREEVMKAMERSGVVKAYFAGHHHMGGYAQVRGVHHVTFESILDSTHKVGAFGVVELREDRIVIDGIGDLTSRVLQLGE